METERIAAASCALGMLAYVAVRSLFPASDAAGAEQVDPEPIPVLTAPQIADDCELAAVLLERVQGQDPDRPLRLN